MAVASDCKTDSSQAGRDNCFTGVESEPDLLFSSGMNSRPVFCYAALLKIIWHDAVVSGDKIAHDHRLIRKQYNDRWASVFNCSSIDHVIRIVPFAAGSLFMTSAFDQWMSPRGEITMRNVSILLAIPAVLAVAACGQSRESAADGGSGTTGTTSGTATGTDSTTTMGTDSMSGSGTAGMAGTDGSSGGMAAPATAGGGTASPEPMAEPGTAGSNLNSGAGNTGAGDNGPNTPPSTGTTPQI